MTDNMIAKIREHYEHAKKKHPYFCDGLLPCDVPDGDDEKTVRSEIDHVLGDCRARIKRGIELGNVLFCEVLNCEVWEVHDAIARKDTAAAVEECYDAISVLLRTVDVLEGRQPLGKPKEGEE